MFKSHCFVRFLLERTYMHGSILIVNIIQWNPSCEATLFASEKWPFKRGGLSSGVEIYIYVLIYIVKWPFQKGWPLKKVASQKGIHCSKHYVIVILKQQHVYNVSDSYILAKFTSENGNMSKIGHGMLTSLVAIFPYG